MLQKTFALEERQKRRLLEIAIQNESDLETKKNSKLYEANNSNANHSLLDEEEAQGRELVRSMVQKSTPQIAPVVRVLNNVQGNFQLFYPVYKK